MVLSGGSVDNTGQVQGGAGGDGGSGFALHALGAGGVGGAGGEGLDSAGILSITNAGSILGPS